MEPKSHVFTPLRLVLLTAMFLVPSHYCLGAEKIFISNKFTSDIYIIDAAAFTVEKTIPNESAEIFAADNKNIYLIDTALISVFDKKDFKLINDIEFNAHPTPGLGRAVITPDQRKMYVGVIGWGKEETSGIFVVDLRSMKVENILEENQISSDFIALTTDGQKLAVPEGPEIAILNLFDDKNKKRILLKPSEKVVDILFTDNSTMVVASYTDVDNAETKDSIEKGSRIYRININTNDSSTILIPEKVYRLALCQGEIIYALCKGKLYKIGRDMQVMDAKSMNANNLAISTDRKTLYLVSSANNMIMAIDVSTNQILHTLKIGAEPNAILVQ
jgi:YVTN family beta-propeller protein